MLDIAALHPALDPSPPGHSYFKACAALRGEIKDQLAQHLGLEGARTFLLPSTSAAVAAALWCACRAGAKCAPSHPLSQHYPPFLGLFPEGSAAAPAGWTFRTHVSPITGRIDDLCVAGTRIVDGAQSLGTCLGETLLERSDVAIAPLHKHLGLGVGLAVVIIGRTADLPDATRQVFGIVEAGAQSIAVLEQARGRLAESNGAIFNKATLRLDAPVHAACDDHGLALLGDSGPPFACVTTLDGSDIAKRLKPGGWRHLRESNAARFSFDRRGRRGDPALDCTGAFVDAVRTAAGL